MQKLLLIFGALLSLSIVPLGYAEEKISKVESVDSDTASPQKATVQVENSPDAPNWLMDQLFLIQAELKQVDAAGATKENLHKAELKIKDALMRIETLEDFQEQRLNDFDDRINDNKDFYEKALDYINFWGLAFTVIGIFAGVGGYLRINRVREEATTDAKQIAKDVTTEYLKKELQNRLEDFDMKISESNKGFSKHIDLLKSQLEDYLEETRSEAQDKLNAIESVRLKAKNQLQTMNRHISNEDKPEIVKNAKAYPKTLKEWVNKSKANYLNKDYDQALSAIEMALHYDDIDSIDVAKLLNTKGAILEVKGDLDAAINAYDEFLERFKGNDSSEIQFYQANSLLNKGNLLEEQGLYSKSLQSFDELLVRFEGSASPEIEDLVVAALNNKATVLGMIGQFNSSLDVYDELLEQFEDSSRPNIEKQIARALLNKGITLGDLNHVDEEVDVYEQLFKRFKEHADHEIVGLVARTLINQGLALTRQSKYSQAIESYDRFIKLFGDNPRPEIQTLLVQALVNKGVVLAKYSKNLESLEVFKQVINLYLKSTQLEIEVLVAHSFLNQGRLHSEQKEFDLAIAVYDRMLERFESHENIEIRKLVDLCKKLKNGAQDEGEVS